MRVLQRPVEITAKSIKLRCLSVGAAHRITTEKIVQFGKTWCIGIYVYGRGVVLTFQLLLF